MQKNIDDFTDIGFKRYVNKNFPLQSGQEREFVKCKKCSNRAYYDFQPYSLSNPIQTSPCPHFPVKEFYKSF